MENIYNMKTINIMYKHAKYMSCIPCACQETVLCETDASQILDESIFWLTELDQKQPIWSRLYHANCMGHSRLLSYNKVGSYDVEIPQRLYSLWGNAGAHSQMAEKMTGFGRYQWVCNVLVCCAVLSCSLNEWSPQLLDDIIYRGAMVFAELCQKHQLINREFHFRHMNTVMQFHGTNYRVQVAEKTKGFLYIPYGHNEFNLARALSWFLQFYQFGILECRQRYVAFGFAVDVEQGYFMYDCQRRGEPLLRDNQSNSYVLRTNHLQVLLYCLIVALNVTAENVRFRIYNVDVIIDDPKERIALKKRVYVPIITNHMKARTKETKEKSLEKGKNVTAFRLSAGTDDNSLNMVDTKMLETEIKKIQTTCSRQPSNKANMDTHEISIPNCIIVKSDDIDDDIQTSYRQRNRKQLTGKVTFTLKEENADLIKFPYQNVAKIVTKPNSSKEFATISASKKDNNDPLVDKNDVKTNKYSSLAKKETILNHREPQIQHSSGHAKTNIAVRKLLPKGDTITKPNKENIISKSKTNPFVGTNVTSTTAHSSSAKCATTRSIPSAKTKYEQKDVSPSIESLYNNPQFASNINPATTYTSAQYLRKPTIHLPQYLAKKNMSPKKSTNESLLSLTKRIMGNVEKESSSYDSMESKQSQEDTRTLPILPLNERISKLSKDAHSFSSRVHKTAYEEIIDSPKHIGSTTPTSVTLNDTYKHEESLHVMASVQTLKPFESNTQINLNSISKNEHQPKRRNITTNLISKDNKNLTNNSQYWLKKHSVENPSKPITIATKYRQKCNVTKSNKMSSSKPSKYLNSLGPITSSVKTSSYFKQPSKNRSQSDLIQLQDVTKPNILGFTVYLLKNHPRSMLNNSDE